MADLPVDVLTVVLAHLDAADVLACAGTCADWRRVARAEALHRAWPLAAYFSAMRMQVRSDAYLLRSMTARCPTPYQYVCGTCKACVAQIAMCSRCRSARGTAPRTR